MDGSPSQPALEGRDRRIPRVAGMANVIASDFLVRRLSALADFRIAGLGEVTKSRHGVQESFPSAPRISAEISEQPFPEMRDYTDDHFFSADRTRRARR